MSFRTVRIVNRCKLEYSLNYLIYRGEEDKKILLDEISVLIIETQQACFTSALISALAKKKIKVIFCDEKCRPASEIVSYYDNYTNYTKIKQQVNWSKEASDLIWKEIITQKIFNQKRVLSKLEAIDEANLLEEYMNTIEPGDISNREAHASKVYFHKLFGIKFSRDDDNNQNKYLNYGYSILASCISRDIKISGYLTEIGIHHIGVTNAFNLTYDMIEPLRPLIDSYVVLGKVNDSNYKKLFAQILSIQVKFDSQMMYLENAISLYIHSIINAINKENPHLIKFIDYEL